MADEMVMLTQGPAEKIRSASVIDDYQRTFFGLFADRLANVEEVVPFGVVMCLVLLEHDLVEGVNGFTGGPMPHKLSGPLPRILTQLAVKRLEEFFPEEFAKEVRAQWDDLARKSQG